MIRVARPLLALGLALGLAACQKPAEPAKPAAPAAAPASTPGTTAPATPAAAPLAANSVGVAECDNYITKYLACVSSKVPEGARAQMQSNIEQMRDAWKASAVTDAGRAALAQACLAASDAAKTSMVAFGCTDF